jgi:hypothetical protein
VNDHTIHIQNQWQYGVDPDANIVITTTDGEYTLTFADLELHSDFIRTCLIAYGDAAVAVIKGDAA